MVCANNYETVSKFVEVMQKKTVASFFGQGVYKCAYIIWSVALPFPEIIGGTQKIWAVPGYAHAPFSPNFKGAFVHMDAVNTSAKFELRSFTLS